MKLIRRGIIHHMAFLDPLHFVRSAQLKKSMDYSHLVPNTNLVARSRSHRVLINC